MYFSFFKVRFEPERANSVANKLKRAEFAQKLLQFQGEGWPILFMDETNFNLHCIRCYGRLKKGTRCNIVTAASRGANIHTIGAISERGLLNVEIKRGSFTAELANLYIKTVFRKGHEVFSGPVVLVIDNAPCHSRVEQILSEEEFAADKILRLAPYSPMLNPIEEAWSILKSSVKRNLANQMSSILNNEGQGNLTQCEYRLQMLESAIRQNINCITEEKCRSFIAHIQCHIGPSLQHENVTF